MRALWLALALLLAGAVLARRAPRAARTDANELPARTPGLAQALLGPVASLAASAQWLRAERALREGQLELGLERARFALELDPGSGSGWAMLLQHEALYCGSLEREPDTQRRVAWLQAALASAQAGERSAREPQTVALALGAALAYKLDGDPELVSAWPGGEADLRARRTAAFERSGWLEPGAPVH
jgi:hypothetical protein